MNNVRVVHALKSLEGKPNEPVAVKRRLGWTIYGMCSPENGLASNITPHIYHICFHSYNSDELLHEAVKSYFALEGLGIGAPQNQILSKEDERELAKLRSSTTFQNGCYQVALMWRYDNVRLPNNRSMTLRRNLCLTKRMEREPELAMIMRSKMLDYEQKGDTFANSRRKRVERLEIECGTFRSSQFTTSTNQGRFGLSSMLPLPSGVFP